MPQASPWINDQPIGLVVDQAEAASQSDLETVLSENRIVE